MNCYATEDREGRRGRGGVVALRKLTGRQDFASPAHGRR